MRSMIRAGASVSIMTPSRSEVASVIPSPFRLLMKTKIADLSGIDVVVQTGGLEASPVVGPAVLEGQHQHTAPFVRMKTNERPSARER